jgi:hypothetical protein
MAYKQAIAALGMMVAAAPISAMQPQLRAGAGAPEAAPGARYCLRVDPPTGSRIETIRCETREGWAELGVDVDQEWGMWGVRIVDSMPRNS